jgi:hypothetical protein
VFSYCAVERVPEPRSPICRGWGRSQSRPIYVTELPVRSHWRVSSTRTVAALLCVLLRFQLEAISKRSQPNSLNLAFGTTHIHMSTGTSVSEQCEEPVTLWWRSHVPSAMAKMSRYCFRPPRTCRCCLEATYRMIGHGLSEQEVSGRGWMTRSTLWLRTFAGSLDTKFSS